MNRNAPDMTDPLALVLEYLRIIPRYGWWIFLVTLITTFAAWAYIAKMQDYYQATTTILVDPQKIPERYVATTVVADPAQRLNTISQEVLSATRLSQIIDAYQLYPELQKAMFREDIVALMRRNIAIEVRSGGGSALSAFTITYTSTNPKVVAQVTNELAGGFIDWNLRERHQQVTGTTEFLKGELERAREDLREQEGKLGAFKIKHAGEMPDQQPGNIQVLSHLQQQFQANRESLNRLDMQRSALLKAAETAGSSGTSLNPNSERAQLTAEKRDLERRLADLRKRYTPAFPDVSSTSRRLEQVSARLRELPVETPVADAAKPTVSPSDNPELALVEREMKKLNEEQTQISSQIKAYQNKIEIAPIREQQVVDLSRNYQVSSNNYSSLLDKTYNSELAGQLEARQQAERFTIVDPARVPDRPFKPKRRTLMMGALFAALCFSVATAFAKELTSGVIRGEKEMKDLLPANATVVAAIPLIDTRAMQRRRLLIRTAGVVIALLACAAEVAYMMHVKPVL